MPEERLYIKLVMPKQGREKQKPGGGGKVEPFRPVTSAGLGKLVAGLDAAEELLARAPLQRPVVPLRATFISKALAKSHWREALFDERSCPVIGAGKPGELFLGSSGITRGFSIGWCEGTGKKTKEFLEWNPGWAKPG
jgi:hypothetical protein